MTIEFPKEFSERMKHLLGDEYPLFEKSLSEPPVRGIRVNETKISTENFERIATHHLTPIEYYKGGFIPDEWNGIGTSAEHHAGMIYVQDPGAMATLGALDIRKGWWVLDTCAAPGGKSSQIADKIGEEGFLLSNEYVPKRAKILVGNLERMGVRSSMVTSLDTAEFPKMFRGVFDLVLCDAPCSGEGMFRKSEEAVIDWSKENVLKCALRQKEILNNIAGCVRPGGYLLYSTCTYSLEENEWVVDDFLSSHSEFSLVKVKDELAHMTSDGIKGESEHDLNLCRRFYPHRSHGEGQFIALMHKSENSGDLTSILYKSASKSLSKADDAIVRKFLFEALGGMPRGKLTYQGEGVALIPHECPIPSSGVFMPGVMLGEIKKGIFFPHHQFFSAYGRDMLKKENIDIADKRLACYLRGEEIEARESDSGWVAVCCEGAPIGGGKASSGRIKNHYPKGLRNK